MLGRLLISSPLFASFSPMSTLSTKSVNSGDERGKLFTNKIKNKGKMTEKINGINTNPSQTWVELVIALISFVAISQMRLIFIIPTPNLEVY